MGKLLTHEDEEACTIKSIYMVNLLHEYIYSLRFTIIVILAFFTQIKENYKYIIIPYLTFYFLLNWKLQLTIIQWLQGQNWNFDTYKPRITNIVKQN